MLNNWVSQAHRWASGYKPWPFSEGRVSTTFASGSGANADEYNFEGYKADSFRIITIGNKRLQKLNFDDYLIMRENNSGTTDRVYTDFSNTLYINPGIDTSGTLVAYGQFIPANFDATDGTENTVFTSTADDGNQAIIEEMISYAYKRDGKKGEAVNQHLLAKQILDELWQRIRDEQFAYQSHKDRGGMFTRVDVLEGDYEDGINEDQFN
jgi:sarcosine oxidase delta subunit